MKILFTQFTPPFTQIYSSLIGNRRSAEKKYLQYQDWYSNLRRLSAQKNNVKFVSLTNKKKMIYFFYDGYECLFFPITNPKEKVKGGRWDFNAPGLLQWVLEFDPDIVHIVGTGQMMGAEIQNTILSNRSFMWERGQFNSFQSKWEELHKARFLVAPTKVACAEGRKYFPKSQFLTFPLGANVTTFKPLKAFEKKFDIISVGSHKRKGKRIPLIESIVKRNKLSWLHIGSIRKGWPYKKWEDMVFFYKIRAFLSLSLLKKARYYSHTSGFVANSLMSQMYNQAKVCIHPSTAEGAPRCVQEALACEIPVVVLKGTVPYVEPEFGIACDSHEDFEEAIMSLLGDPQKRKKMGKAGREWLLEKHTPEKLYEAIEQAQTLISYSIE